MTASPANAKLTESTTPAPLKKLWIYTNYDCNLSCSYCVAESTPKAARRALSLFTVMRLIDEAYSLQFEQAYFTGGEPFLLVDIFTMLAYSCQFMQTTVLTNGMLFRGKQIDRLCAVHNDNLIVQVSLDGSQAEQHDAYRGKGSWARTVQGIHRLQERGFRVRLSTTETPSNSDHLAEICDFHLSLDIPEEDHIIRPLAKRGFSKQGLEVNKHTLLPEITINTEGVFWHPLSTDADMLVTSKVFPLSTAVSLVKKELDQIAGCSQAHLKSFQ
jgi:MoaA/NifB/PqqE/SkfB family radical SAM enzyme